MVTEFASRIVPARLSSSGALAPGRFSKRTSAFATRSRGCLDRPQCMHARRVKDLRALAHTHTRPGPTGARAAAAIPNAAARAEADCLRGNETATAGNLRT